MKTVTALAGQTVFDIATQEMGSVEGVFEILAVNAFLRLDQDIPAGTKVFVPDAVINAAVVDFYLRNNIKPVSGLGEEITLNQEDMININQAIGYSLDAGDTALAGVRLANMGDEFTVQVNYHDLAGDATVIVQQSLDGVNYSDINDLSYKLDEGETIHSFNASGIVTNFCRIRIESNATAGIIDEIIWRT